MPQFLTTALEFILLPFAILVALVLLIAALPIKRTRDRSPEEVAKSLRDFIDGTGGDRDWDDFESVSITDPELDAIRQEAFLAGPPDADLDALKALIERTEAMIDERRRKTPL